MNAQAVWQSSTSIAVEVERRFPFFLLHHELAPHASLDDVINPRYRSSKGSLSSRTYRRGSKLKSALASSWPETKLTFVSDFLPGCRIASTIREMLESDKVRLPRLAGSILPLTSGWSARRQEAKAYRS